MEAGGRCDAGVGKGGDRGWWPTDEEWQELRRKGSAAGWLASPQEVELGKRIGSGCFGTTYRGRWRGIICAIKVVRVSKPGEAISFLREVSALSDVKHPNVMPFYGAVLDPPEQCWLICEFMSGGTLATWLYGPCADPRSGGSSLWGPKHSLGARVEAALDVARGMAALECTTPPLVHRDLKPSNVFIDGSGAAVVADLGLARPVATGADVMTGETGTFYYMAPEVIQSKPYGCPVDVFSWAILFAELLAGKPPYADLYLTPVQVAQGVVQGGTRPTLPKGLPPGLEALARQAWHEDPALRPSFAAIVDTLTPLATEVQQGKADGAAHGGFLHRLFGSAPPSDHHQSQPQSQPQPQQHHNHHTHHYMHLGK
mmetsp:Transcript_17672/g.53171  ORF Transcript_17672/g.53171 Transcript_17672/m.53171 type:complete len:371 (+) Transcript_17672:418-1530(+)|eukprot:CAMPEP_0206137106 /NCGR_PEP_ID=MMETSP1473-20131121/2280_1 /ASSEMBLY_ACC=CAM_ASM_001109 /TAXON_ID=1461547 /ORGANISM="Stichococcus sp, Strain RCC1054" /LENGTH=370 /DNA_ID=CAMNT_0053530029 /DNA_START=328 /DNA_END=1440 /DNA_ORIENTATION=+